MTKLIFDIIPPHRRVQAKKFWQENSGQIKLGVALTSLFIFVAVALVIFVPVKPVKAALPTFVNCGAAAGSAAGISPALPAGIQANDILLLFVETAAQAVTVSNGNGGTWAEVLNSPQTAGTTTQLTVFWSRYNGTQGAPTTSDSGDHQVGAICAYNGVETSGDPWDVTSGSVDTASDTSGTITGATTSGTDRLVVIVGAGDDDADTPITGVSNADLANISVSRVNAETAQGNDGGLTVFDGEKAGQGAYGNTTLTYTAATTKGMMTIALKPAPPANTIAISVSGTQATPVNAGTTGNFADGKFILTRTFGPSTNITAIAISETDATFSASLLLSNATLKYDLDISNPYDCAGETYAGTESTFQTGVSFVSEKASFTNAGVAITTTQTFCGYLIYNISGNAPGGDTIEFQITANGDVTDSGASTISGAPAAVTGATTIIAPTDGAIQYGNDHSTILATGGTITSGQTAYLDAHVSSGTTTETFTPKVEVRTTATSFTGTSTSSGTPVIYDATRPDQRRSTDMVYDSANKQLVLFGGYGGDSALANMNDVWVLSLAIGGRPQWKQLSPSGTAPSARRGLQLIYDSVDTAGGSVDNGRVIVYGGTTGTIDNTGVYALTMTPGSEAWSTLTTSGTAPVFALQHNTAYDPVRDQMLVFGGRDSGSNLGGVMYKLEMNGGTEAWGVVHDGTGTTAGARELSGMIYDTTNNYVWVHGGCVGATVAACVTSMNTWRLKNLDTTPVWENASPASCPPNAAIAAHGMGFDSTNNQAVVWAGLNASTYTANVYTFTLPASGNVACANHTPPAAQLPYARGYGSVKGVFDPNRNAMFFGWGYDTTTYNYELQVFDDLANAGVWGIKGADGVSYIRKRDQMMTVYDPVAQVAYGYGGAGRAVVSLSHHLNETWRFQITNNSERWENAGVDFAPFAREAGVFIWDTVDTAGGSNDGGRGIYCGGLNLVRRTIDCWQLTPPASAGGRASWTHISPTGTAPGERWGAAAIYDSVNDRMLFWGGEGNTSNYYNDVWELSLSGSLVWTNRTPGSGGPAGGRKFSQAVYDSNSSRMVIYGGSNATTYTADVWSLSVGTPGSEAWTQLSPAGCDATCDRDRHIAIYDSANDRMITFGGYDGTAHYGDIWQLTLGVTPAWSKFTPATSGPATRRSMKGFYDPVNTRFIIAFGRNDSDFYDDTWAFDTSSGSEDWKNLNPRKTVPITVGAAPADGDYHWQIWATGSTSGDSAKATYGGNSDVPTAGIDFTVQANSMSVSGTVCTNEACSTNVGSGIAVVLKKNGADACSGACTATTIAGGAYTISNIQGAGQNDVFHIYVGGTAATDEDATYNAVTVTKIFSNGNLASINLVTSEILLRHEGSVTEITNADLGAWDKDNDADIKFTSNTNNFVGDNTEELHILTGKTYAPGGTVTTSATSTQAGVGADVHIEGVLNMVANVLSVGGDFINAGTFTASAGQDTNFTATGTGFGIDNGAGGNLQDIIFNGVNGGWSFSDASNTIDGDLTVTAGTLSGTVNVTVNGGDMTGNGTITMTSGTVTMDTAGSTTGFGGDSNWTFSSLSFGNGVGSALTITTIGTGILTVSSSLAVNNDYILNGTKNIVVGGTANGAGGITLTGGTFEMRGPGAANFGPTVATFTDTWTFNNLTFSNSSGASNRTVTVVNTDAGTTIVVTGTLQIGKSTDSFNTIVDVETNDETIDVDGSVDIQSKGELKASSSAPFTIAGSWTRNGTFNLTGYTGTVTFNCLAASCPTMLVGQSTTFYSVSFVNSPANLTKIVKFGDATTLTTSAGGVLTVTGFDGTNLVELDSNTGGSTTWNITHDATATEAVNWAGVKNSSCVSSSDITTTDSTNRGNNGACWIFAGAPTLTQRAYIFEDDDGTNSNTNNSQVANNTSRTGVKKGERLNVRIQLDNTGTGPSTAATYDLQVCNFTDTACDIPAEWATISGSTDIRPSLGLSAGSGDDLTTSGADRAINTTASGTDCVQAGPTFDITANTSEWYENTGTSNSIVITNNKCNEMSFAVHTGAATLNKEYRFRIVKTSGATVLDVYSQYPALTIASAEDIRYSKDIPGSLGTTSGDLTYYFDLKGYNAAASDDATRDPLTSSTTYAVFNFARKHPNTNEAPDIRWDGQSSVAPLTRAVTVQAYRFGATNAWETITSNSSGAADTDFELNSTGWTPAGPASEYFDGSTWAYIRAYQNSGAQTLRTDRISWGTYRSTAYIISRTFDTNTSNGAGFSSISWRGTKPTGTNMKLQLATSNCSNGATNYPTCNSGSWGSGSDYVGDDGTGCATTKYYTPATNTTQKLKGCVATLNNKRYFRYKAILDANGTRDLIPQVDDVIVGWTP